MTLRDREFAVKPRSAIAHHVGLDENTVDFESSGVLATAIPVGADPPLVGIVRVVAIGIGWGAGPRNFVFVVVLHCHVERAVHGLHIPGTAGNGRTQIRERARGAHSRGRVPPQVVHPEFTVDGV